MRYPKRIQKGNTIGLVAPSYGCSIEPYKTLLPAAIRQWEEWGYRIAQGPNCTKGDGIGISTTPELCARELMDYYCSPDNQCLFSVGGGELMCETIAHIDFERLKEADPKWFVGLSDNTNFTFLLTTLCDVVSVYSNCFPDYGQETMHPSLTDTLEILDGSRSAISNYPLWELDQIKDADHPFAPYNCTEPYCHVTYIGDRTVGSGGINLPDKLPQMEKLNMKGRFLGGCIDVLNSLCGTRFDEVKSFNERYKEDGIIWFLEACDYSPMDLRRALWHLREAGWFDTAKGFLIGRPMRIREDDFLGVTWENAVLSQLGEFGVPIVRNVDIGHLKPTMPVLTGAYAEVRADEQQLSISYVR